MSTFALNERARPLGGILMAAPGRSALGYLGGHRDGRGCLATARGHRQRGRRHFPRRPCRTVLGLVGRGDRTGHHFKCHRDVCHRYLRRRVGPFPTPTFDHPRHRVGTVRPFHDLGGRPDIPVDVGHHHARDHLSHRGYRRRVSGRVNWCPGGFVDHRLASYRDISRGRANGDDYRAPVRGRRRQPDGPLPQASVRNRHSAARCPRRHSHYPGQRYAGS